MNFLFTINNLQMSVLLTNAIENYDDVERDLQLLEAKYIDDPTDENKQLIVDAKYTMSIATIFRRAFKPRKVTMYDEKFMNAFEKERTAFIIANKDAQIYIEAKVKSDESKDPADLAATEIASTTSKHSEVYATKCRDATKIAIK